MCIWVITFTQIWIMSSSIFFLPVEIAKFQVNSRINAPRTKLLIAEDELFSMFTPLSLLKTI